MTKDFIGNHIDNESLTKRELKEIHKRLIYRHVAWLTALRFQLRQPRAWEKMREMHEKEYNRFYHIPEWETDLEKELKPYLSGEDLTYILSKQNRATQLLSLQSADLRELRKRKLIDSYPYVEMENALKTFFSHQGKAERIKNFPYPRQFATLNTYFVWLFIFLVPFGMMQEINERLDPEFVWLTIPFTVLVGWVFHTMEKMGGATENPFEGGANDIPMTALSRSIEIDLREMLDETDIPTAISPVNDILM